ncbi:MAG: type I DNA topoisomerase [Bacteroidetes bacterium]|nr:type I DNA topoisomerase [Bacteroidota bacterium]
MSKNLVIVESPAKAKTIEGYLGQDFTVKSSYGHIRDLPKGGESVDVEQGFEPKYVVADDKKQLVKELKAAAKKAEVVWLATDEDREGEAISWHLYETLNLKPESTKRIVFSEITKNAILKSIENPRTVDVNLVNAQQARRILDRLVGFDLSPVLWRKVKPGLSAGRVQSVAVRIIVEREREINEFEPTVDFRIVGEFMVNDQVVKATLNERFKKEGESKAFLTDCASASHHVVSLVTKPTTRKPAAPFTTSTLQQEASRKLGFSVARTMRVAQGLYESGMITYMRTDSTNLSEEALKQAKSVIVSEFGDAYSNPKQFTGKKSKGAQEAHEAIRPSDMSRNGIEGERDQVRLYDLIWKRTIASQMADAKLENTTATIDVSTRPENFIAKGQVITFDGFLKVYLEGKDDEGDDSEQDGRLPQMTEGQAMSRTRVIATERFSKHSPRFTEASLVKRLEELGIGRPSTYAPTISTVQKRGYVEKGDRDGTPRDFRILTLENGVVSAKTETENTGVERAKLFPTDIGMVVNDFLLEHFNQIMDFNFTAEVEEQFDTIAQGQMDWRAMLKDFYQGFKKNVDNTQENAERASGERKLGVHPESGKTVLVRIGRYGPLAQIGDPEDEEKEFASLLKTQSLESITLEEALDLFKLPRKLGELDGKVVTAAIGRFGPYVRYDGSFVSLKAADGDDPYTVTLERATELIMAKRAADAKALIKVFDEDETVRILEGRYGPYIKAGKKNVTIPKSEDPHSINWERAQELIAEAATRPKGRRRKS